MREDNDDGGHITNNTRHTNMMIIHSLNRVGRIKCILQSFAYLCLPSRAAGTKDLTALLTCATPNEVFSEDDADEDEDDEDEDCCSDGETVESGCACADAAADPAVVDVAGAMVGGGGGGGGRGCCDLEAKAARTWGGGGGGMEGTNPAAAAANG